VFENNRLENIYARASCWAKLRREFLDPNKPYESYDGIIRNNVIKNVAALVLRPLLPQCQDLSEYLL